MTPRELMETLSRTDAEQARLMMAMTPELDPRIRRVIADEINELESLAEWCESELGDCDDTN